MNRHGRFCTSTDSNGGKSRTIGVQVTASTDAYTWPPVVPK